MQYEYDFEYMFPEIMEGAADGVATGMIGMVIGIFLIVYLLALAFSVISYVLGAVGAYRIAKRRGIHHAWLSWIPVGSSWLLGSISDHYQYVVKQKVTKRRKILLILSIICTVMGFVFGVGAGILATAEIVGETAASVLSAALMVVGYLGLMGLSIAITVICYIAYYDLFRSCKPGNAVLFLVLSIIFNVTLPFFVFFISNSDEGMPARRPQRAPQQICEEPECSDSAEEELPVVEAEIVDDSEL